MLWTEWGGWVLLVVPQKQVGGREVMTVLFFCPRIIGEASCGSLDEGERK